MAASIKTPTLKFYQVICPLHNWAKSCTPGAAAELCCKSVGCLDLEDGWAEL